jgi:predicted RNA-binding protein YlxR (DUF448 family)
MTLSAEHTPSAKAAARAEHARERRCIVTGDVLPEARLIRFVADPASRVTVDVAAKLPGRGLWVRSERGPVERAVERRLFSRAGKASLEADPDLADQVEARLAERMLAQLGLALRAGQLLLGFDGVEKALRAGRTALVIGASDASPDGTRKLQGAAVSAGLVPYVIGCFSGPELSLALGRANVVHAALKPGRMAERLIFDAERLSGFRPLKSWKWVGFSGGPAATPREPPSYEQRV